MTEFRPTHKHGNADCLSRLPLNNHLHTKKVDAASLFNIHQIGIHPVKADQLRLQTMQDPVLAKVLNCTQNGWPSSVGPKLKPFFDRRLEITIEAGCLMWGIKVVIPSKLRERVLNELHTGHPGIVKMKSLARTLVWWPGIDKALESFIQNCYSCQSLRNNVTATPLHPWGWPSAPWHRVDIDFAGPFMGQQFLIMVDAHSK